MLVEKKKQTYRARGQRKSQTHQGKREPPCTTNYFPQAGCQNRNVTEQGEEEKNPACDPGAEMASRPAALSLRSI